MGKRKGRRSEITETLEGDDEDRNGRSEEDLEDGDKSGFFACYLLTSLCPRFKGHTYIGFTVNPRRRIRQHNGEICSGASRTKKKRPWEMVFCIYGFPTNVAALQFEWAWQHPVESLAVREAAVGFKSLGGLANKIKLAYTMLTLPAWNNLNLTVNFFSTKYTKHYAGCPSLPSHMRVHVRSMDELPCYTEGYTEGEDDMFRFENHSWDDDEEPDIAVGSEATFTDATIPVLVSEEATCVLDIEDHEQPSCSNDSPGYTTERSTIDLSSVVPATMEDENAKMECGTGSRSGAAIDIDGPGTKISASSGEVEVIDLFTPSPELRTKSRRTKSRISVVCPEIIDLTQSPIYV
ncbi:hypothetical protein L6452_42889 [Arctium lappa]|uniref:Uncharacterized protein n=1 Tax=Arctium lappa TaxID=4217 RepID=A0ACB8XIZ7_ARCLA|nr:hypothetical protein L6452_42889 [Arctium lappa]